MLLRQFGGGGVIIHPVRGGIATELSYDASGGRQEVWVLTDSPFTAPWRIENISDWVTTEGGGGQNPTDPPGIYRGDGQVRVRVSPNPSSQPRTVTILMSEQPLKIIQAGR